jgi:L-iditol 2-dehydrogenase
VAIDRFASRLDVAGSLGATLTLDASAFEDAELVARVREHAGGRGADVVHDCTGAPQTFVNALRMVRAGGVVVEAGAFVDLGPVAVDPNRDICAPNVTVIGVGGETIAGYVTALELLTRNRDRLPIDRIVTHRMPLERAREAIDLSQRDGALKVVFDPSL